MGGQQTTQMHFATQQYYYLQRDAEHFPNRLLEEAQYMET